MVNYLDNFNDETYNHYFNEHKFLKETFKDSKYDPHGHIYLESIDKEEFMNNYFPNSVDKQLDNRENIHQYFMNIAHAVKTRSTCIKRKVGAIIVKNKKIISTGYNNPSTGLSNCNKDNCLLDNNHKCVRAIHSEVNAILQAPPDERIGATMYVTTQPCANCQLAILNSGITRVIYDEEHNPKFNWFENTHVQCNSLNEILAMKGR